MAEAQLAAPAKRAKVKRGKAEVAKLATAALELGEDSEGEAEWLDTSATEGPKRFQASAVVGKAPPFASCGWVAILTCAKVFPCPSTPKVMRSHSTSISARRPIRR